MAGLTQAELSKQSDVNIRQIQRVELGEAEAGNLTAKNIIALADALGVDVRSLI
jgi:transcriptional regulator with XRE-family HTH domain